jgi:hypothetical protein
MPCQAGHGTTRGNDRANPGTDADQSNPTNHGDLATGSAASRTTHDLAPPDAPLAPQECTDNEHD